MFIIFSLKSENRFIKNGIVKKQVGCVVSSIHKGVIIKIIIRNLKNIFPFSERSLADISKNIFGSVICSTT